MDEAQTQTTRRLVRLVVTNQDNGDTRHYTLDETSAYWLISCMSDWTIRAALYIEVRDVN